jgi:hypothetical protein
VRAASARQAWLRWLAAAGPWRGWSICPTLLSPEVEALSPLPQPPADTAQRLAASLLPLLEPGGVLCLLDLDPILGVRTAARLADHAHPVLVLPRWPYAEAVLPCHALALILVSEARGLPRQPNRLPNVVFVVDGARQQALARRSQQDPRADNRHSLAIFELPDLATLRARGIRRIHRVQSR